MIAAVVEQKPMSREERKKAKVNGDVKEMWWITEEENRGDKLPTVDDIEQPRSPPLKPSVYPTADIHRRGGSSRDFNDFRDDRKHRKGLDLYDENLGDMLTADSNLGRHAGYSQPMDSFEFKRGELQNKGSQRSIDKIIAEDVQFSSSIERLLNSYPKPTASLENYVGRNDESRYRLRSISPQRDIVRNSILRDSQDVGGTGTLKGLLLSLKLDGGKLPPPEADDKYAEDGTNMKEKLQAIIDSLTCLDEATADSKTQGTGVLADNIQQVYSQLHSDMTSFTAIYEEKYSKEDEAEKERSKRDDEMREEGRREQLKSLQQNFFRVLDETPVNTEIGVDLNGDEEMKSSPFPTPSGNSAVIAITEARLRAKWTDKDSRPVWSSQLGRYVLPPHDNKESNPVKTEEEALPLYKPLFSSHSEFNGTLETHLVPSPGLSHGSITSAARAAIESCLNVTEQSLLIRLPGELKAEEGPANCVLNEVIATCTTQSDDKAPVGKVEVENVTLSIAKADRIEIAQSIQKVEGGSQGLRINETDATLSKSTRDELDKLDMILGEDKDESKSPNNVTEVKSKIQLSRNTNQQKLNVQFHDLNEIDRALSSIPPLPPPPTYQHTLKEKRVSEANFDWCAGKTLTNVGCIDNSAPDAPPSFLLYNKDFHNNHQKHHGPNHSPDRSLENFWGQQQFSSSVAVSDFNSHPSGGDHDIPTESRRSHFQHNGMHIDEGTFNTRVDRAKAHDNVESIGQQLNYYERKTLLDKMKRFRLQLTS